MISDSPLLKGRRWPVIIVMQAGTLIGVSILAAWNVSDKVKYFAYYISYFSAGVPGPYYAWYSDLIPHDHEMRGFVIAGQSPPLSKSLSKEGKSYLSHYTNNRSVEYV